MIRKRLLVAFIRFRGGFNNWLHIYISVEDLVWNIERSIFNSTKDFVFKNLIFFAEFRFWTPYVKMGFKKVLYRINLVISGNFDFGFK